MRVIAGKYKGAQLASPRGKVRPTTDLVKGSLFSMLESKGLIRDACCLDLFCGSGALGIEALSRGARSCVFADENIDNVSVNADKLGLRERKIKADFRTALRILRGSKFDIVFCDPPYGTDYAEKTYGLLIKYGMLSECGVVVLEYSSGKTLNGIPEDRIADNRIFGATAFMTVRGNNESDICGNV